MARGVCCAPAPITYAGIAKACDAKPPPAEPIRSLVRSFLHRRNQEQEPELLRASVRSSRIVAELQDLLSSGAEEGWVAGKGGKVIDESPLRRALRPGSPQRFPATRSLLLYCLVHDLVRCQEPRLHERP